MLKRAFNGCLLLLQVISLLSITCYGQSDPKVDSLLRVLKDMKEDTGRVNTLNNLSKQFLRINQVPEALKYGQEALALAQKISYKKGEAAVHKNIGMIHTREYNPPEARKSFLQFLKLCEETGDKYEAAIAYNNIANSYFNESNYPEALKNHFASLRLKKEIGDKPGIIMSYNNIGLVNWNQGNYPEAYKNYFAGLKAREEMKDWKGVAHSYNVLGIVYDDEGNYPEALKNYLASLKMYEKLGLKFGIAACFNNIGELYRKQNNHPEALRNFQASINMAKEINDEGQLATAYNNIAGVFQAMGNYEEARKHTEASFKICEGMDDKQGMAFAYGNMGTLFYEEGKTLADASRRLIFFNNALDRGFKGLKLFEEVNYPDGITESYILIGSIYTDLKNYTAARKFLTDGLALSKERGVKETIKNNYQALARLDSLTANWEGAYRNHSSYIVLRDSSVNQENTGKLLRLQLQYDFNKKEDSLAYLQVLSNEKLTQQTLLNQQQQQLLLLNEKDLALISNDRKLQALRMQRDSAEYATHKIEADKKQAQLELLSKEKTIQALQLNKEKQLRRYLFAGLGLFLILAFFVYRNYRNREQLKLLAMRNKIASDLHDDIGSTLSSISIFSQMAQQQSGEVAPLLESIGENSRKMLDAMADIVWTINPENDQFEKIVLRMRSFAFELLGAKKIDFEFSADDDITSMKLPMGVRKNLYLIFKEATNNLVKYSGANKALFTIKGEKNNLSMMIYDNGKGFDTRQPTQGNGLKNMKKRAEEMGAQFVINSAAGKGTTIELQVAV